MTVCFLAETNGRNRWLRGFALLQIALIAGSALLPFWDLGVCTCQIVFAVVLTESALATVWLTLGPGPVAARLLVAPLWLLVAAAAGGATDRPRGSFPFLLMVGGTLAAALATVLLVARWRMRISLLRSEEMGARVRFQFRIIHLVVLMLCVAILLTLGRLVSEHQVLLRFYSDDVLSAILGSVWAMALLPAILVPLTPAGSVRWSWRLAIAGTATVISSAGSVWLIACLVPGPPTPPRFLSALIVIPVVASIAIFGSLLMIRSAGYHLVKWR